MNKTEFKKTMLISPVKMAGDRWHNEDVEFFMEGTTQTPLTQKVQDFIVKITTGNQRWIHRSMSKGDLRILRSLCRAKSPATVLKRKKMFLDHQLKSHYGALFNKHKIETFMEMFLA